MLETIVHEFNSKFFDGEPMATIRGNQIIVELPHSDTESATMNQVGDYYHFHIYDTRKPFPVVANVEMMTRDESAEDVANRLMFVCQSRMTGDV